MVFGSVWTCYDLSDAKWNHGIGVCAGEACEGAAAMPVAGYWIGGTNRPTSWAKALDHLRSSRSFWVHFPMYQCDLLGAPLLRTFHHLVFLVTLCFPVSFLPMSSGLPLRLPQVWVIAKNSHNGPKHWRLFPAKLSCCPRSLVPSFPRSSHVLPGQASISQLPSSRPRFLPLNCGTPIEILQASKSGVLAFRIFQDDFFLVEGRINEDDHSTKHSTFSEFVSPNSHQPTPSVGCDGWSRCVWADLPDGGEANEKMCVEAVTVTLLEAANGGIALLFDWEMPAGGSEINEIMISQIHSCGWLHSWLPLEKSGGLELSDADEAKKFLQTKNAFVASWLWNQVLKVLEAESDAKPPEAVRFAENWTAKTQNGMNFRWRLGFVMISII